MTVTDMETAVSRATADGDTVHLAGFVHAAPFAAGHELIRQGVEEITLSRLSPDLIYDQLLGAGCPARLLFSFASDAVRRAMRGTSRAALPFEFEEYTHYGLAARLAAGARGMPFAPVSTFAGSDLPAHNDAIRTVESPYGDGEIHTVPPLEPDVTFAHVQRADPRGNAHAWGITGEIRDAAFAAETVVLSVEEVVDERVIRSDPGRTVLPGAAVDYLVEEPYGAHPSYVQGYYGRDRAVYDAWDSVAGTDERLAEWLEEWVYGVADRREYLAKLGTDRLLDLAPGRNYAAPIDMGAYG